MSARLIDGKAIAQRVREEVAADAARLRASGIAPGLAVVLVGDDPASQVYVRSKHRAAEQAGVETFDHKLPAATSPYHLFGLIDELNAEPSVDGILVQMPVPGHIDSDAVIDRISPDKDVDGLHPHSLGLLAQKRPRFIACTPQGCMRLLVEAGAELEGARAVVIGRSNLVGRPMAMLLSNANATVTVCHSRTRELTAEVARADIVIAAIGRPELVRGDWIKPGAVVIDVGINRAADGSLVGDVAFAEAVGRAAAITPVPGGVGPMTIAMLLANTVRAAELRRGARA